MREHHDALVVSTISDAAKLDDVLAHLAVEALCLSSHVLLWGVEGLEVGEEGVQRVVRNKTLGRLQHLARSGEGSNTEASGRR